MKPPVEAWWGDEVAVGRLTGAWWGALCGVESTERLFSRTVACGDGTVVGIEGARHVTWSTGVAAWGDRSGCLKLATASVNDAPPNTADITENRVLQCSSPSSENIREGSNGESSSSENTVMHHVEPQKRSLHSFQGWGCETADVTRHQQGKECPSSRRGQGISGDLVRQSARARGGGLVGAAYAAEGKDDDRAHIHGGYI